MPQCFKTPLRGWSSSNHPHNNSTLADDTAAITQRVKPTATLECILKIIILETDQLENQRPR